MMMQRDSESNALISTDRMALDKYRIEKQKTKRMSDLEREVRDLKLEVKKLSELFANIDERV
jgi:hypothetical protein